MEHTGNVLLSCGIALWVIGTAGFVFVSRTRRREPAVAAQLRFYALGSVAYFLFLGPRAAGLNAVVSLICAGLGLACAIAALVSAIQAIRLRPRRVL